MTDEQVSDWQKKIEGRWYGRPSLFDAQGNHVGYEYVDRASVVKDGVTTYYMDTRLEGSGPLRNRFDTLRVVADPERYERLVGQAASARSVTRDSLASSGFFPAYRA